MPNTPVFNLIRTNGIKLQGSKLDASSYGRNLCSNKNNSNCICLEYNIKNMFQTWNFLLRSHSRSYVYKVHWFRKLSKLNISVHISSFQLSFQFFRLNHSLVRYTFQFSPTITFGNGITVLESFRFQTMRLFFFKRFRLWSLLYEQ